MYLYVVLVGFFAFAAIYHLILWLSSRRDFFLAVFAVDCVVRAALSASLAAVVTATTVAEANSAVRARIALGMLMMVTWLWSLSYVAKIRPRWFVWPITGLFLVLVPIQAFLVPLNATVIRIEHSVMPWGETISNPQLGPQGWWVRPLYFLSIVIAVFGLICGRRLWARDRMAAVLVLATACGTVLVLTLEVLRSYGMVSVPYFGVIPQVFWVCAIAFLIARDHRQTREQLTASEQRLRGIFDQTFQFMGLLATDGTLIAANRTALEFLELRESDVVGKPFWQTPWWIHSPRLQERLRQAIRDAAGGRVVRFEANHPRPDGKLAFVDFSLKPVRNPRGEITLLIPEGREITERIIAEESLRQSESRYRQLVENAPYCIHELDVEGRFVSINTAGLRMMELNDAACIIGTRYLDAVAPSEQPRIAQLLASAAAGVASAFEFKAANGRLMSSNFVPLTGGTIMGITQDITLRKRTEESLRISQQQLASLFNASPLPEVRYNLADGRITDVNQRFLDVFEITRDEAIGKTGVELGLWCDTSARDQLVARVRQDHVVGHFEARLRARNGREFDMVISAQVIELDTGPTVILQANDVTESRRAAETLRASEERFRALVEHGFEGISILDDRGMLVYAGPGNEAVLGYSADRVRGRNLFELIHPDDLSQAQATWSGVRQNPEQVYAHRLRYRHQNGSWHWLEATARNLLHHPAVRGVVINWRDITERKQAEDERCKLEAQLLQAQKLESLGVLAGGIAHDFNNLLTVVLGNASLSLSQLPAASPAGPMLREIEQAAQRAAELTQQMLTYSGKSKFVVQRVQLDDLVGQMTKLLKTVVSKKATVELNLQPATIEGDATQVRQVVMNLIINASDALDGNVGAIQIRTGVRWAVAAELRSPFFPDELPAGDYAFVEVVDTGCGMNAETQARIFDPFFTTKFTGRGLGLAATLGIVRSHRGTIKVTSAPGRGTTFQVFFPTAVAAPIAVVAPNRELMTPRGYGMVLLVDDERSVHLFARRVLESVGFTVLTAGDGREALNLLLQHAAEIVIVLLDLTMPGMDGREFLRELSSLRSVVPVLVMSGYSEQEAAVDCSGTGASGFIQKPFAPAELITRVFDLLPASAHAGAKGG